MLSRLKIERFPKGKCVQGHGKRITLYILSRLIYCAEVYNEQLSIIYLLSLVGILWPCIVFVYPS